MWFVLGVGFILGGVLLWLRDAYHRWWFRATRRAEAEARRTALDGSPDGIVHDEGW